MSVTAQGYAWLLSGGRLVDRTLYLALLESDPTSAGDMSSELSGAGYARQPLSWTISGTPTESNTVACTFTASGGDWPEAKYFAIVDSGGTAYAYGAITPSSVTVLDGQSVQFGIGAVTMQGSV